MAVHGAGGGHRAEAPATYWVDKTALNEFHVRALRVAFPEARFIHMVRDPRAIFASHKQANISVFGTPGNPFRRSYKIGQSFRLARQNQAFLGQSTYHVVRYEDLLSNLLDELAALRAFLGITDHESLMQPTSSGLPCVANSSYDLPFTTGQVQDHSATYYQNILTPVEHKLIGCFTGRHARALDAELFESRAGVCRRLWHRKVSGE